MEIGPAALEDRILAGGDRRLQLTAARGGLDLTPQRAMLMQVMLADNSDAEIAEVAGAALAAYPVVDLAETLDATANRKILTYYATNSRDPVVLESILRNSNAGASILALLLPRLPSALVYLLTQREDALLEDPSLVDLVEVRSSRSATREPLDLHADVEESPEDEDGDGGEATRARRLSEGQIRTLSVSVRLKLCRGASRDLRKIMIRDPNPSIAVAVLEFNALGDSEVESIAANKNIAAEVLGVILRDRRWPQNRAIALALVKNPKVQTGSAIRLLSGLSVRELGKVAADRGVPEAVRRQAGGLYRIKIR